MRRLWRHQWFRYAVAAACVPVVLLSFLAGYYWVTFGRLIDARLHGERDTVLPRVFARPLELRRGQSLTDRQLIDRLNDLGYAQRPTPSRPGEFATAPGAVAIVPRGSEFKSQVVRVVFQRQTVPDVRTASRKPAPVRPADHVLQLDLANQPSERLTLDAPVLTALGNGAEREKKRPSIRSGCWGRRSPT